MMTLDEANALVDRLVNTYLVSSVVDGLAVVLERTELAAELTFEEGGEQAFLAEIEATSVGFVVLTCGHFTDANPSIWLTPETQVFTL